MLPLSCALWSMLRGLYTPRIRRGREWARRLSGPFTARLPLVCAALSGAAGLLYQVIWNRQLLLLFGSTSAAVAAVVAAFMGGMGLGAWGVERWDLKDRRRAGSRCPRPWRSRMLMS